MHVSPVTRKCDQLHSVFVHAHPIPAANDMLVWISHHPADSVAHIEPMEQIYPIVLQMFSVPVRTVHVK